MEGSAMKKILLGVFALGLAGAGVAHGQTQAVRLYIAPNSTVAPPDIMRNLVSKCQDTTITVDPLQSDFMLEARGASGNYKFTLFQQGGIAIYGATTVTLSNAVKDVCNFLQSQTQLNVTPAAPPSNLPQLANVSAKSLNTVTNNLTNAADDLRKAANQSDYVQNAIAQIEQALAETKQAAANIHDDSGEVPKAGRNFVFDAAPPPPAPRANFMLYSSLDSLRLAYEALNRVQGGGFGGYRAQVNEDIVGAALVLVDGIASDNANHPR
jgi:hypothetical protein